MEAVAAVATIIAGAIAVLAWLTGGQTLKDLLSRARRRISRGRLGSASRREAVMGLTDATPRPIRVQFELIATGQVVEVSVVPNLSLGELKRSVMRELSLSDQFTDGRVAETQVVSKTRGIALDERLSLEENGVKEGEIFHLVFSHRAG